MIIREIPVHDLRVASTEYGIDPSQAYQRPLKPGRLRQFIRRGFDRDLCHVIDVAERPDGSLWIIDGHHRWALAKHNGIRTLLCRAIPSTGPAFEARLFRESNIHRTRPLAIENYQAAVVERNPQALEMMQFLASRGLRFGKHDGNIRTIAFVNEFAAAWRSDKPSAMRSLSHATALNGGQSIHHRTFAGLFYLERRGLRLDQHLLKLIRAGGQDAILQEFAAVKLKLGYLSRTNAANMVARAIVNILNRGRRSRKIVLPEGEP